MRVLAQPIVFVLVLLWLQHDVSLRVRQVTSPKRPLALAESGGLAVFEVSMRPNAAAAEKRFVGGDVEFVETALDALREWKWLRGSAGVPAMSSVTFLFRPRSAAPGLFSFKRSVPLLGDDLPALPTTIVDPGYPPVCLGDGTTILEVELASDGGIVRTNKVAGPPAFDDYTDQAIRKWRFSPARMNGKAVASRVYVVLSFVRPAGGM